MRNFFVYKKRSLESLLSFTFLKIKVKVFDLSFTFSYFFKIKVKVLLNSQAFFVCKKNLFKSIAEILDK